MRKTKSQRTIVILDAINLRKDRLTREQTMGISRVSVQALKANMEAALTDVAEMFNNVQHVLGNCRVAHVDLSLGLAVDGSVGIFGSRVGGEAKGGITVRLVFKETRKS